MKSKETYEEYHGRNLGLELFLLSMALIFIGSASSEWFTSLFAYGISVVVLFLSVVVGGFGGQLIDEVISIFSKINLR